MRFSGLTRSGGTSILALLLLCGCGKGAADSEAPVPLRIGPHVFHVEVAASGPQREHGLMGRTSLPDDGGMLFVFDDEGRHCFWMRDTRLPLSIAFVDETGRITSLDDMQPQTTDLHCATIPVRYALEVKLGAFASRGIGPGARITGGPLAPPLDDRSEE